MVIKSMFKNGSFRPIDKIEKDFKEGDVVEIDVRKKKEFSWRGALRKTKKSSVELQHKIKDMW